MAEPYLLSLLARFSAPQTVLPEVSQLVQTLYGNLARAVINNEFQTTTAKVETRMIEHTPQGVYEGVVLTRQQKVVVVSIARAGILPSQVCFDLLNHAIEPECVRMDHVFMNRKVNEQGQVIGVDLSGSKIGGPADDTLVLLPDPMGATGVSMAQTVDIYKEQVEGTPRGLIAMNLIVTPEYIRTMKEKHPDVSIYALRLDRGLSTEKALNTTPGTHWDEEQGLNQHQYIVPGAGGIGEVLNNAFV